jgi:hypothetical protein
MHRLWQSVTLMTFCYLSPLVDSPTPPIGFLVMVLFICDILIEADNEQFNIMVPRTSPYELRTNHAGLYRHIHAG